MSSEVLKEGTTVRILSYESRPEFDGKEAEIGNFSEKDKTYECWLTDDALEGTYALCARDQFEVVEKEEPAAKEDAGPMKTFAVGDRVKGTDSGKLGTVTAVDGDGDPKVKLDGEDDAVQRFGKEFEVVEKALFAVGDKVRGKDSGKLGTVTALDEDGDPKVKLDGEDEALQRFGKEFEVVTKAADRTSRSRSGSSDDKKKKGKKKKKKRSSSSSSSSSSKGKRSNSGDRHKKRGGGFGRSTLEKLDDEKKRQRKFQKQKGVGQDAALRLLGLR